MKLQRLQEAQVQVNFDVACIQEARLQEVVTEDATAADTIRENGVWQHGRGRNRTLAMVGRGSKVAVVRAWEHPCVQVGYHRGWAIVNCYVPGVARKVERDTTLQALGRTVNGLTQQGWPVALAMDANTEADVGSGKHSAARHREAEHMCEWLKDNSMLPCKNSEPTWRREGNRPSVIDMICLNVKGRQLAGDVQVAVWWQCREHEDHACLHLELPVVGNLVGKRQRGKAKTFKLEQSYANHIAVRGQWREALAELAERAVAQPYKTASHLMEDVDAAARRVLGTHFSSGPPPQHGLRSRPEHELRGAVRKRGREERDNSRVREAHGKRPRERGGDNVQRRTTKKRRLGGGVNEEVKEEYIRLLRKRMKDALEGQEFDEVFKNQMLTRFEQLMQASPGPEGSLDRCPDEQEVRECLSRLKTGKKANGLAAEAFKYGGEEMVRLLHPVVARVWNEGVWEQFLRTANEGVIPKPGRTGVSVDDVRVISILPVFSKVLEMVITDRITGFLEGEGKLLQCIFGSRRKRSPQECALVFTEARLRCEEREAYYLFIDFRAAFPSTWLQAMLVQLWDLGVRGKLWKMVAGVYTNILIQPEDGSDPVPLGVGVITGSTAAPILFVLLMQILAKELVDADLGVTIDGVAVSLLQYLDDQMSIHGSFEDMQKAAEIVLAFAKKYRLQVNVRVGKSEYMRDTPEQDKEEVAVPDLWVGNVVIGATSQYKHMGVSVMPHNRLDAHVQRKRKQARALCGVLKQEGWGVEDPLIDVVQLLRSRVLASLDFGAGSTAWSVTHARVLQEEEAAKPVLVTIRSLFGDLIHEEEELDGMEESLGLLCTYLRWCREALLLYAWVSRTPADRLTNQLRASWTHRSEGRSWFTLVQQELLGPRNIRESIMARSDHFGKYLTASLHQEQAVSWRAKMLRNPVVADVYSSLGHKGALAHPSPLYLNHGSSRAQRCIALMRVGVLPRPKFEVHGTVVWKPKTRVCPLCNGDLSVTHLLQSCAELRMEYQTLLAKFGELGLAPLERVWKSWTPARRAACLLSLSQEPAIMSRTESRNDPAARFAACAASFVERVWRTVETARV